MQTLNELIQAVEYEIREKSIDNALDLLTSFDRYVGEDWKFYFYPLKNESRYQVLHQDDDFKLVLIYWNSYDKSKKHGHMKGGGLMRVLSGRLKETRFNAYDVDLDIGTFAYAEGDLSYIHDALAFHIVENQDEIPAVSLHLYCTGTDSTFGLLEDVTVN